MIEEMISLDEAVSGILNGDFRIRIETGDRFEVLCQALEEAGLGKKYFDEGIDTMYEYSQHWVGEYPYLGADHCREAVCWLRADGKEIMLEQIVIPGFITVNEEMIEEAQSLW